MKLLLHAFQLFCLTPILSTKGNKFFLAEVKNGQTVDNSRVTSDIGEKSESQGQDYFHVSSDYVEGKKNISKPGKSEDEIFHPSKERLQNPQSRKVSVRGVPPPRGGYGQDFSVKLAKKT